MAEDIWEKSKYKVKAKLVDDSKPYDGKVDLYLLKNGDESAPLSSEKDITVKPGKAIERSFDVPEVGPKEKTYKLSLLAKFGVSKEKSQELADATVWPKTIEVHVKNEIDDKNFKDVKLQVMQGGKAVAKPLTDADGKCKVELTRKEDYALESRTPYEIVKENTTPEAIRKHELIAARRIVATFVKPDVTKSKPWVANAVPNNEANRKLASRLYVNLESKKTDAAEAQGHVIEFEVCAKPKGEGKKDDRIYIEVAFSRDSDRDDPLPKVLDSPAVSDLSNAADPKVYTGYVKLDKDGGSAKFKVETGLAGGDTCTVSIGGRKDATTDEVRSFVNWRKLFYELRYPGLLKSKLNKGDYAEALKTAVTAKLGAAFVEYELAKSHSFSNGQATFEKMNGMIMPKAFFKGGAGDIYVVTNGWLDTTNKFSDNADMRTRTIYVSLCQRSFSSNVSDYTVEPEVKAADHDVNLPAGYNVFPKRPDDGTANLSVIGGYEWKAIVANPHPQATTWAEESGGGGSAGHVTITAPDRPGKTLTVAFPAKNGGGFENALDAAEQLKVDNFVADLLSSDPDLRDTGNVLKLRFAGPPADGGAIRLAAVRTAAKLKFDGVAKTVDVHPGLDRDGNPRTGPMDLAWLSVKDYLTIRVQLPTSPAATPAHRKVLPGDFVGAAESDTKCKVTVKFGFTAGGEINGNSGDGSQIMVLREAATDGALSETVCHELGHSMGMSIVPGLANDLLPPGLATKHVDNGGTSYKDGDPPYPLDDGKRSIHKGGHCAFSVPAPKRAHDSFDGWSPAAGCIMWGSGDNVETRTSFCPECLKLIKGRRLENIKSPFDGRGADQG